MSGADSIGNLFIEIQANLDKLNGQLKQIEGKIVKDAKSIGEKAGRQMSESMKQGLSTVRNTATVATAALTAGLASASNKAKEFEFSMSKVQAVSRLDLNIPEQAELFDQLNQKAQELGRTTEFTAAEAANGLEFLARAGLNATEQMEALGPSIDLATAGNISLAQSADIATNIMGQFGKDAGDLGQVFDVLAYTSSTSNTNISEFAEAAKYLGPTMNALGVSIEDTAGVIGILANNGIKGSLAGRALGTSLVRLANPTTAMADVMRDLGISFFDANGDFIGVEATIRTLESSMAGLTQEQKQAALSTLFGAEALQEMNILLNEGSDGYAEYTDGINKSSGALKKQAAIMRDNFRGTIKQLVSAFDGLQIAIGTKLNEKLQTFAKAVTQVIGRITERAEAHPDLAANIFLATTAVTALVAGVAAASLAIGPLTTAFTVLTGPIGLVIAGVAALGVAWATDFGGIRETTTNVINTIVGHIQGFIVSMKKILGLDSKEAMDGFILGLKQFGIYVEAIFGGIADAVGIILEGLFGFIRIAVVSITGTVKTRLQILTGDFDGARNTIKATVEGVFDALGLDFDAFVENTKAFMQQIVEGLQQFGEDWQVGWSVISKATSEKRNAIKSVIDNVLKAISALVKLYLNTRSTLFSATLSFIQGDWEGARTAVESVLKQTFELLGLDFDAFKAKIESRVDSIKNKIEQFGKDRQTGWDTIRKGTGEAIEGMKKEVLKIIQNMVNTGIRLVNKMITAANQIPGVTLDTIEEVNYLMDEQTKEAEKTGARMVQKTAEGLLSNMPTLEDSIQGISTTIAKIADAEDEASVRGASISQALANGLSSKLGVIKSTAQSIATAVTGALADVARLTNIGNGKTGQASAFAGGTLIPNRPTLVGEHGPEIVIPSGRASVLPNHTINKTITINNGDFTTNTTPDRFASELERALGNIRM